MTVRCVCFVATGGSLASPRHERAHIDVARGSELCFLIAAAVVRVREHYGSEAIPAARPLFSRKALPLGRAATCLRVSAQRETGRGVGIHENVCRSWLTIDLTSHQYWDGAIYAGLPPAQAMFHKGDQNCGEGASSQVREKPGDEAGQTQDSESRKHFGDSKSVACCCLVFPDITVPSEPFVSRGSADSAGTAVKKDGLRERNGSNVHEQQQPQQRRVQKHSSGRIRHYTFSWNEGVLDGGDDKRNWTSTRKDNSYLRPPPVLCSV